MTNLPPSRDEFMGDDDERERYYPGGRRGGEPKLWTVVTSGRPSADDPSDIYEMPEGVFRNASDAGSYVGHEVKDGSMLNYLIFTICSCCGKQASKATIMWDGRNGRWEKVERGF